MEMGVESPPQLLRHSANPLRDRKINLCFLCSGLGTQNGQVGRGGPNDFRASGPSRKLEADLGRHPSLEDEAGSQISESKRKKNKPVVAVAELTSQAKWPYFCSFSPLEVLCPMHTNTHTHTHTCQDFRKGDVLAQRLNLPRPLACLTTGLGGLKSVHLRFSKSSDWRLSTFQQRALPLPVRRQAGSPSGWDEAFTFPFLPHRLSLPCGSQKRSVERRVRLRRVACVPVGG